MRNVAGLLHSTDRHRDLVSCRYVVVIALSAVVAIAPNAMAVNEPCSGSKGGISNCQGETFVCNDGSVSASKKSCTQYIGGAMGVVGGTAGSMAPVAGSSCSCRSGTYCTGPKGGRYCTTDSGDKSYLRK